MSYGAYHTFFFINQIARNSKSSFAHTALLQLSPTDETHFQLALNPHITKATWYKLSKNAKSRIQQTLAYQDLDDAQITHLLKKGGKKVRTALYRSGMKNASNNLVSQIINREDFTILDALTWYESKSLTGYAISQIDELFPEVKENLPKNYYEKNYETIYRKYHYIDYRIVKIEKRSRKDELVLSLLTILMPKKYKNKILKQKISDRGFNASKNADIQKLLLVYLTKELDPQGVKAWELFIGMIQDWEDDMISLLTTVKTLMV